MRGGRPSGSRGVEYARLDPPRVQEPPFERGLRVRRAAVRGWQRVEDEGSIHCDAITPVRTLPWVKAKKQCWPRGGA